MEGPAWGHLRKRHPPPNTHKGQPTPGEGVATGNQTHKPHIHRFIRRSNRVSPTLPTVFFHLRNLRDLRITPRSPSSQRERSALQHRLKPLRRLCCASRKVALITTSSLGTRTKSGQKNCSPPRPSGTRRAAVPPRTTSKSHTLPEGAMPILRKTVSTLEKNFLPLRNPFHSKQTPANTSPLLQATESAPFSQ